jgi:hypothetical protein
MSMTCFETWGGSLPERPKSSFPESSAGVGPQVLCLTVLHEPHGDGNGVERVECLT